MMPLIAFVMRFYSMSYESILALRVRTFFCLYKEGSKLQAKEYLESLNIALSPRQDNQWYSMLSSQYQSAMSPEPKKLPPKPLRPSLDAGSVEAKNAVIGFFSKRGLHGRR